MKGQAHCGAAGINLTHVPYQGGAHAMNDVIAGPVQTVAVNTLGSADARQGVQAAVAGGL